MLSRTLRHLALTRAPALGLALTALPASSLAATTYEDVATIVADNCSSCHASDVAFGDIVLDTEADLKANAVKALAAVEAGVMPLGNPEFKDSPEGKLLIDYLSTLPAATK